MQFLSRIGRDRFRSRYASLVAEGKIRPDPRQTPVVELFHTLTEQLESGLHRRQPSLPSPSSSSGSRFFPSWLTPSTPSPVTTNTVPRVPGVYLYGGCGTGKTMLMDLFFATVKLDRKKRVHFHEYMLDVHSRLFRLQRDSAARMAKCDTEWTSVSASAQRKALTTSATDSVPESTDLVARVAEELIAEAELICFDEFQVTFISDAVIMRRLFSIMFARGVVVVATSNRPPDDLYLNGLNRELFTPFIPLLKQHCVVHNMDSAVDYRQLTSASSERGTVYFAPLSSEPAARLESKFFALAKNRIDYNTTSLEVQGRTVAIRRVAKCSPIAWFSFKELCDKPLGSADYIEVAKRFHTVFIEGVPQLTIQERDQVRRFITLVDALYDHHVRIVCSSEALTVGDIFIIDEATRISSGMDEVFAWDRTASRLTEMMSVEYQTAHTRRLSPTDFFGQLDLDEAIGEDDLHELFVRYGGTDDSVISIDGLNRMIAEIRKVVNERPEGASPSAVLVQTLTGRPDGPEIQFDNFKAFVDSNGLLALIESRA